MLVVVSLKIVSSIRHISAKKEGKSSFLLSTHKYILMLVRLSHDTIRKFEFAYVCYNKKALLSSSGFCDILYYLFRLEEVQHEQKCMP